MISQKQFIFAIIAGIIWTITYLYVRRYMNPENKGNIDKWKMDGIYGGLATFVAVIMRDIMNDYAKSIFNL
jgi:hypothetical protein